MRADAAVDFPKKQPTGNVTSVNTPAADALSMPAQSHAAFIEQALRDYESPLIAYAQSLLRNHEQARDVVQDTFIRLCRQAPEAVAAKLKSWLFTVCRNRALDLIRQEKRKLQLADAQWQSLADGRPQPDQAAEHGDRHSQLTALLARLPENQREVILLKFQHDLSYRQIQQITGLSSGNIGFLIHTGIQQLRRSLPHDLL
jgi:RNA polymerase sigma factor (sigma-70 family)